MLNKNCPKCGYCPTCGRSNQFGVGGVYPYAPVWSITNISELNFNVGSQQIHYNHSSILDECKDNKK